MTRHLLFLGCGALFGSGLAISGMTDPGKVTGFLDLTGRWDPSLALVMAGAVGTFALLRLLVLRRERPLWGDRFPDPPGRTIDVRLVVGAAMFGVGWGMAGLCPGPAIANLATFRPEVLAFVAAMCAGMLLAQRLAGADS